MARRSKGEGSIFFLESKDLWVGKITLPDGKRKTKYNKRQSVVKDWLLAERNKLKLGIFVSDDKMTVEAFLRRYLEDYGKRSLRVTTYESYKSIVEKQIIPELGSIRLSTLRADQINHLISKLEKVRSARHAEYVYAILKASLNKAVKWELIPKNPALMVSPPQVPFKVPDTWSATQMQTFLDHIKNDRWSGIYYLACTGMRKGEILGSPLKALDLENGFLVVIQNLQFVAGQGIIMLEPKTDKSRRMIVLPDFVKEALRIHLAKRQILSQSPSWKESGLLFTTDIGTPINPHNLLKHFKQKTAEVGLPRIKFHSLRHSVASILLEKNVHPKLVAELLGHSTTTLTLSTYSHIINPLNTVASDMLQKAITTP